MNLITCFMPKGIYTKMPYTLVPESLSTRPNIYSVQSTCHNIFNVQNISQKLDHKTR